MKNKQLWVWNWVGGGFNQDYAASKEEALSLAAKKWPTGKVDEATLRPLTEDGEKTYWKWFPSID